ncbi:sensor histidine kinase [Glycomyces terrestris]|nr:histidine kinase [Glycomyces terrestris]
MRTAERRIAAAWARPPAAGADGPRPRDAVPVGLAAAVGVLEAALRPDLPWPAATAAVTLAVLPVLLWRRTRPLVAVAGMAAATTGLALAHRIAVVEPNALFATFVLLSIPYALFRWGSGSDRIIGAAALAVDLLFTSSLSSDPLAETAAGVAFLGGACLLGALRRERVESRERRLDQVRAREREALARDLHDTVAHHVSAIVIRAQVAGADPGDKARVAESLRVIETEAQAVLADMRSLVRTLRAPADYRPTAGLEELARLAEPGPPPVAVSVAAPADLPGIVASTLFRIAQEGVTNARRHARGATRIDVEVTVDEREARVRVRDDGAPPRPASGDGHGLQGMAERAALLGGEVDAGPDPVGGWTLRASIPLGGKA